MGSACAAVWSPRPLAVCLVLAAALACAACETSRAGPADAALVADASDGLLPDRGQPDTLAPDQGLPDNGAPDQQAPDQQPPDQLAPDLVPPDACLPQTFYLDADGDGFGGAKVALACNAPQNYVAIGGDCDDKDPLVNPKAKELCNNKDDNCNSFVDEGTAKLIFFKDGDGDSYGSKATLLACQAPPGFVALGGDCNDNNKAINPGAKEACNDVDDNCDGFVDEGFTKQYFYKDNDGDKYGGGTATKLSCAAPKGYVAQGGDCDDYNVKIHPGAPEQCNKKDDDCDGKVDDQLTLLTSYKDNDGDGYPPLNAATQKKCEVPPGWALPKDADGDKQPDWDCDDSDVTIYPGAPTKCGDGKDNNCDGHADRLCFTPCPGQWSSGPFKFKHNYSTVDYVLLADLDGDGQHEIITGEDYGFAILDSAGKALHAYSSVSNLNWARGTPVLADIDGYDSFKEEAQTLEVLTGNGGRPRFYKLNADKTVTIYSGKDGLYDASTFLGRDLDGDGSTEFISAVGCGATAARVFRFDKKSGQIVLAGSVADPDKSCNYTNGRMLTDLNGDGAPELVWGNGYATSYSPTNWSGRIHAAKLSSSLPLTSAAYCAPGACFSTAISGSHGGSTGALFRVGQELRSGVYYFKTNTAGVANAGFNRYWRHGLSGKAQAGSPSTSNTLWGGTTDVNRDGKAEAHGGLVARVGLYDVNGDGYPDQVYASGAELRVRLWNKTKQGFVDNAGSHLKVSIYSVTARAAWDINQDGRLDVLSADPYGRVYCHSLGKGSWSRANSLPPHFTSFARSLQWDPYEPNEGGDTDADNVPDQVVQVPSALTAKGEFYGYLSTAKDKDHYLVNTNHVSNICLKAPTGKQYTLKVYSLLDKWNNSTKAAGADGKKDGLVWHKTTAAGGSACFVGSAVVPYRYYEYRFVVGVEAAGGADFSPHWPYWLTTKK